MSANCHDHFPNKVIKAAVLALPKSAVKNPWITGKNSTRTFFLVLKLDHKLRSQRPTSHSRCGGSRGPALPHKIKYR